MTGAIDLQPEELPRSPVQKETGDRQWGILVQVSDRAQPHQHLNFRLLAPKLREHTFLSSYHTQSLVLCCGSPRKWNTPVTGGGVVGRILSISSALTFPGVNALYFLGGEQVMSHSTPDSKKGRWSWEELMRWALKRDEVLPGEGDLKCKRVLVQRQFSIIGFEDGRGHMITNAGGL